MDRRLDSEDYTIGWICALPVELTAAVAILDERHPLLPQDEGDENAYEFGRVGSCNIIIACLPSGVYGVTSAASVAAQMRRSFPSIKAGLMVGIAGGAPMPPQRDIRLGDVVVSEPVPGFPGVLQYDFGKTVQEGRLVQTGVLNKPPKQFLTAIAKLKSRQNSGINNIITDCLRHGNVPREFARPPSYSDRLFYADYEHPSENASCDRCEVHKVVKRTTRQPDQPRIHYGLIASGNRVIKHGKTRDSLVQEYGMLCFEMEAAGLMDELPSLVIRGICDYSDSHKSKVWQPYAALSAAAFAKTLLLRLPPKAANNESNRTEKITLNLPIAEGAAFGSYADRHEPECLDGTRVDILEDIIKWADDPQGKSIFWLVGRAGTGKSTISRTIARKLQTKEQLAASFFFKRSEADRSDSKRFFSTIAGQLAGNYRCTMSSVQKAIQAHPDIFTKAPKEQFDKLILQPLSEAKFAYHRPRLVLLIDALDECDGEEDIEDIISLLAQLKDIQPVDVRVFLTSRPDLPIRPTFKRLPEGTYKDIILHEVPKIEHDISLFLQYELSKIQKKHKLPDIQKERSPPQKWPGDERIRRLVGMAMPLFIYAATLCRYIGDKNWDPEERIKGIIEYQSDCRLSQLQKTYLPILDKLTVDQNEAEKKRLIEEFRQIVGTIVNLASPLSASSLASLLSISENIVKRRLNPLHSVLDVPEDSHAAVRTFHLSFRDFLLDRSLQNKSPFWVDEKESHRIIADKCIELLSGSAGLRMDICELGSPGKMRSEIDERVIGEHLPPELRYACCYWVYHLKRGGQFLADNSQTHSFLQKHLLHWLEAASLLNIASEISTAVDILISMIDIDNGKGISAFVHDIKRFVLQNQYIISKAPLQTYCSALVFAPKRSMVRHTFKPEKVIGWASQLPRAQEEWDSSLQTLVYTDLLPPSWYTNVATSVAFSPDGKMLASGSNDERVRLWDLATGAALDILYGHTKRVNSVAFSPNSKILASGSDDKMVILWNPATGAVLDILRGHTNGIHSVVFSPNGKTLASASRDETVRLWDLATGAMLRTLSGHTKGVNSVAFSPDVKTLASASADEIIRLWDPATGAALRILEGHTDVVEDIAFSPNGKTLASAGWDKTVRLWDTATGAMLNMLQGHTEWVTSIAFSPDGKTLASAGWGKTVRLWDTATGAMLNMLQGHTGLVNSVAFSPDGKALALGSRDRTVRLWDPAIGAVLDTRSRHTGQVHSVVFSPNRKILASASNDKTVRLWDAATGAALNTLNGHTGSVRSVAFSPDSKTLASASWDDDTVRLWDTATGAVLNMLQGHTGSVRSVAFSPDGKVLASGSDDKIIRLWDPATGAALRILEGHTYAVKDIAFSPDGMTLASVTSNTIRLWDSTTGAALNTLGAYHGPDSVVFSPDGKVLMSASWNGTVRLWDPATGAELQTWDTEEDLTDLHFSEDGRFINFASGSLLIEAADKDEEQHERILIEYEWLIRGGERLIWLPPDYRASCSATYKNMIVLGHDSGGVSFFTFNSSNSYFLS